MQVYKYDTETGEYLSPVELQKNPKRAGEYLIPPANTTPTRPPNAGENQAAVFDTSLNRWVLTDDYRGREYWLPDGTFQKVENIGEALPKEALDQPPPPSESEKYAALLAQRNDWLTGSDWFVQRHGDELALGMDTTLTAQEYKEIQQWRQALRQLPQQYPDSDSWVWPAVPAVLKGEQ
ncbi:phage tail assembly chaperone [Endozoicomonas acroporae]|uniref:phage tail assembly chaperone n=1 Tax=Endozoicomonas acroporae TaxID=1701104 RepID=UPI003D7945ED